MLVGSVVLFRKEVGGSGEEESGTGVAWGLDRLRTGGKIFIDKCILSLHT